MTTAVRTGFESKKGRQIAAVSELFCEMCNGVCVNSPLPLQSKHPRSRKASGVLMPYFVAPNYCNSRRLNTSVNSATVSIIPMTMK